MKPITEEQEMEIASEFTLDCWKRFVEGGGLKTIGNTLGPVGDHEARIFEAGWKLGFMQCLMAGREFNKFLSQNN